MKLSTKAIDRLCNDLGDLVTRYEALSRQVMTLHIQGKSNHQSAYYVGAAQTLARGIRNDLDLLSNAVYNISLHQKDERTDNPPAAEKNPPSQRRQEERTQAQADPGAGLDTTGPGTGDVRDQVATETVDQPGTDQPVV